MRLRALPAVALAALLPACGGGDAMVVLVNLPPQAVNDILEVTALGATSVDVLANDRDPEGTPLTVSIEEAAAVGTASVNADRTVRLDLPAQFRGVTRFKYRVTDSGNASRVATAVVFVGIPKQRMVFAAETGAQNVELFLTDFIATAQISRATPGSAPVAAFQVSLRGSFIVYARGDSVSPLPTTTSLEVVRTNPISAPFSIAAPPGRLIVVSAPVISVDDRWIAFSTVAINPGPPTAEFYAVDVAAPGVAIPIGGADQSDTRGLHFVDDPSVVYVLGAREGGAEGAALYRIEIGTSATPERLSPPLAAGDTNDGLFVSQDQKRVVIAGTRGGERRWLFIDPEIPGVESWLTPDVTGGATFTMLAISRDVSQLAYAAQSPGSPDVRLSVVDVAAGASPHFLADSASGELAGRNMVFRPDGQALLFDRGPPEAPLHDFFEIGLVGPAIETPVVSGVSSVVYDGTGDRIITFHPTHVGVIERTGFGGPDTPLIAGPEFPAQRSVLATASGDIWGALLGNRDTAPAATFTIANAAAPGVLQLSTEGFVIRDIWFPPRLIDVPAP